MTERQPTDDTPPRSYERVSLPPSAADLPADVESCDWCGSTDLWWRNCKLHCRTCSAIVKSCADL